MKIYFFNVVIGKFRLDMVHLSECFSIFCSISLVFEILQSESEDAL